MFWFQNNSPFVAFCGLYSAQISSLPQAINAGMLCMPTRELNLLILAVHRLHTACALRVLPVMRRGTRTIAAPPQRFPVGLKSCPKETNLFGGFLATSLSAGPSAPTRSSRLESNMPGDVRCADSHGYTSSVLGQMIPATIGPVSHVVQPVFITKLEVIADKSRQRVLGY